MKLSGSIIGATLAFVSLVSAAGLQAQSEKAPQSPVGAMVLDLYVDYTFEDQPNIGANDTASFLNGETAVLKYMMASRSEDNVTLVGTGGTLRNPTTHEILYNLTAEALETMIAIKPNGSYDFQKSFEVDFEPATYLLAPEIYLVAGGELKSVPIRNQLLIITNMPLSLFDPQVVFLAALLAAILGASTWFVYSQYGTSPAQRLKSNTQERRTSATGKFDSSWIPQEHLKKPSKKPKSAN